MPRTMTVFGAGHKIAAASLGVFAVITAAAYLIIPGFSFKLSHHVLHWIGGVPLIGYGLYINFASAVQMMRAFKEGKLLIDGYYAVCRNPMYASFIFFTIPGVAMIFWSGLILVGSVILFACVKLLVVDEDRYLEEKFGEAYRRYRSNTGLLVPKI